MSIYIYIYDWTVILERESRLMASRQLFIYLFFLPNRVDLGEGLEC